VELQEPVIAMLRETAKKEALSRLRVPKRSTGADRPVVAVKDL